MLVKKEDVSCLKREKTENFDHEKKSEIFDHSKKFSPQQNNNSMRPSSTRCKSKKDKFEKSSKIVRNSEHSASHTHISVINQLIRFSSFLHFP